MTNPEETAAAPRARRRWWQFSLASLLIMMTVVALCLGVWVDSARRQKRAVQWIRERDGQALYSSEIQKSPNQKLSPPGPDWLREWLGIDYLDYVEHVAVEDESLTDADLATLMRDLPHLTFFTSSTPRTSRMQASLIWHRAMTWKRSASTAHR